MTAHDDPGFLQAMYESLKGLNAQDQGWEDHVDTQYTEESPLAYVGGSGWQPITNNSGTGSRVEYSPENFDLLSDGLIQGRTGSSIILNIEFTAVPSASNTYMEVGIDIGFAEPIYQRLHSFPKGGGFPRAIGYSHAAYTLDTWAANGGQLVVKSSWSFEIYAHRIIVLTNTNP